VREGQCRVLVGGDAATRFPEMSHTEKSSGMETKTKKGGKRIDLG
jgi:hypothetical protein